jgi:hypothetical protein
MIGILKASIKDSDQNFFMAKAIQQLHNTSTQHCVFCDEIQTSVISPLRTNVFPRIQTFYFSDILITDDLTEAQSLPNIPNVKQKFIYLYHLEWAYIENLQFQQIEPILLNDNIELIARSDSHAKLIGELFKEPKYVMPQWDYKTLIEIDNNE